ncbi:MAG: nuclease [Cyanobacteriota bacterium]|nr:nuclease [Cyanobacteriota bacterium]
MLVLGRPASAGAAEVLQVNGPDRLIIGDRNRSSVVLLACMAVTPGSEAQAQQWLRQRLPRRSRVNLRPLGERENHLLARVSPVDAPEIGDLSDGLIGAGLATPLPCS